MNRQQKEEYVINAIANAIQGDFDNSTDAYLFAETLRKALHAMLLAESRLDTMMGHKK